MSDADKAVDMESLALAIGSKQEETMVIHLKGVAPSLDKLEPLIPVTAAPTFAEYEPVLSTKQQRAVSEARNVEMLPLEWRSWPTDKVMAFMILKMTYPVYSAWVERVYRIGKELSGNKEPINAQFLLHLKKAIHQSAVETYNK